MAKSIRRQLIIGKETADEFRQYPIAIWDFYLPSVEGYLDAERKQFKSLISCFDNFKFHYHKTAGIKFWPVCGLRWRSAIL